MLGRPESLATWPIPWRRRWGELTNRLIEDRLPTRAAEWRAWMQAASEREAAGDARREPVWPASDPTLGDFDRSIGWHNASRCLYGEALPPRPDDVPEYGLTAKINIVTFSRLSLRRFAPENWPRLKVVKVTASGWPAWYPIEPTDRERILAAETARREELKLVQRAARLRARQHAKDKRIGSPRGVRRPRRRRA